MARYKIIVTRESTVCNAIKDMVIKQGKADVVDFVDFTSEEGRHLFDTYREAALGDFIDTETGKILQHDEIVELLR